MSKRATYPEEQYRFVGGPDSPADVITHIETFGRDSGFPDGVVQVTASLHHPESGRSIRHVVVHDAARARAIESEVGLVGGDPVFRLDRSDRIRFISGGMFYVRALDELLDVEDYAELVGLAEPVWRLSGGFFERLGEAGGVSD